MTATSAVGHATLKSARMCFEDMTSYAPPYAFRVITVSFGTVASANAYRSFAPWRMIPPHSCAVPGRNPGTSTNVTSGTLKASHVRTKRAALTEASMSRTPASAPGWFPTTPTECPPSRAKPQTMFSAKCGCTSRNWPSSTTRSITCFMSYGLLGLSGTIVSSDASSRSTGSDGGAYGGASRLFCGRNERR